MKKIMLKGFWDKKITLKGFWDQKIMLKDSGMKKYC